MCLLLCAEWVWSQSTEPQTVKGRATLTAPSNTESVPMARPRSGRASEGDKMREEGIRGSALQGVLDTEVHLSPPSPACDIPACPEGWRPAGQGVPGEPWERKPGLLWPSTPPAAPNSPSTRNRVWLQRPMPHCPPAPGECPACLRRGGDVSKAGCLLLGGDRSEGQASPHPEAEGR